MIVEFVIIIIGLILFEVISSVDNAIINANVLKTVSEKYRKIFLFWGIIFAVFVIRGVLPFVIIWIANPQLPLFEIIRIAFTPGQNMSEYLEESTPLLLLGGGMYLFLVFLGWLFLEEKKYAFLVENFLHRQAIWFYALSSLVVTASIYTAIKINPILALAASIGATAFFITDGFKKNAEEKEKELLKPGMSAWSKILYLEVLDASFSIDGVVGAFAFTLSVPLILIGNGIGAFIVRELTVRGIDTISKFAYLKNGAMYSVGFLGALMVFESFGKDYPLWLAPVNTALLLFVFMYLSFREIRKAKK